MLKSNTFNPVFPEEKTFFAALAGDFWLGLDKLLTSFSDSKTHFLWRYGKDNDIPGILVSSPVLLASLFGFPLFFKKDPHKAVLFFVMISISIVVAALHVTVLTRHIFTIMPIIFFPFAYTLRWALTRPKYYNYAAMLMLFSLAMFSAARTLYITAISWEHGHRDFPLYKTELRFFLAFYLPLLTLVFLTLKHKMLSRLTLKLKDAWALND
jgi:hypothetical protein